MKRTVWLLALLSIFAQPFVEATYYAAALRRGAFPPEADSIGIPISQFVFGWLVSLPVVFLFIWFALREYPGSVPLAAHNTSRPVWSFLWSAFLLLLAASYTWFAFQSIRRGFPVDVAAALLSIYLLLCLRSSVVFSSVLVRRSQAIRSV